MRGVVIEEPGQVRLDTVKDPEPGPREVVVAPAAVGICGTDIHILDGEFAGIRYPVVPGHEFAGVVVALGWAVQDLSVGDRVAVNPSVFCGECHYCRVGRGNLCERFNSIGLTRNGGCAEYTVAPLSNCHLLPDGMPLEHGALVEPLSCAVHGFDLLPRRLGEHYLIYGAGTMGLMMAQLARHGGAASVSVVDVNESRLAVARQLAADAVSTSADELDRPAGWEVVIDCTGVVAVIEDGLARVRRGGTFQQFGVAAEDAAASFSPFQVYNNEITIVGSMAVLHSFGRAVELLDRGVIDPHVMITDTFPLSCYEDAVGAFRAGTGRKLLVLPQQRAG